MSVQEAEAASGPERAWEWAGVEPAGQAPALLALVPVVVSVLVEQVSEPFALAWELGEPFRDGARL